MKPSLRKPFGVLGMLLFIAIYGLCIAHFADVIASLPVLVQLIVYLIAGIAWIFPIRPLLGWMEAGPKV